ncbi:unnamed protein product [Trichobilharzia regenti]|nr:unnamed protein product [Trichobilharzia regenti]
MDKPLIALLLPNIHPQNLPKGIQPLLVFVNLKSGGCQGMDLIVAFRRLLNPFQVSTITVVAFFIEWKDFATYFSRYIHHDTDIPPVVV